MNRIDYYNKRELREVFISVVIACAIIGMVIFTGWKVGWWFRAQNAQLEGQVDRSSYAFQQADRDRITTEIGDVFTINTQLPSYVPAEQGPLKAQRKAVVAKVCRDATQLVGDPPIPADQLTFIAQNCSAAAVSPSSPYNQ